MVSIDCDRRSTDLEGCYSEQSLEQQLVEHVVTIVGQGMVEEEMEEICESRRICTRIDLDRSVDVLSSIFYYSSNFASD